jgi:hypothetical protein
MLVVAQHHVATPPIAVRSCQVPISTTTAGAPASIGGLNGDVLA